MVGARVPRPVFYGRGVLADYSFRPVADMGEELEEPQIRDGVYKVKPWSY